MRRSASFGDILVGVIEKYEDELMALDPEYIDGGDDYANRKQEALSSGQIDTALLFTRDRRVKEVLLTIQSDLDRIANGEISFRRSASDTIRNLESRIAKLEKSSGRGDRLQEKQDQAKKLEKILKPVFGSSMRRVYFDYNNSDMFIAEVNAGFWEDTGLDKNGLKTLAKHTDGFTLDGDRVYLNI